MYKISVIMPMYNAKEFVEYSIDSIIRQMPGELEVVVVDDRSTDGSFEYVSEKYKGNDQVQIIQQEKNGGPGAARNKGMKCARGEYISFADSDDAVREGAYKAMYDAALKYDAEVVHMTGAVYPVVDDIPKDLTKLNDDEIYFGDTDRGDLPKEPVMLENDLNDRLEKYLLHKYHWNVWNKLFKKDFLEKYDITFVDMKIAEDQVFCFSALFHATRYVINPGNYYIYRIANESLSRGVKKPEHMQKYFKSMFDCIPAMKKVTEDIDFFEQNPDKRMLATDYILDVIEKAFVAVCYQELGKDAIKNSGVIRQIFEEYFGENSYMAEYLFYQGQDRREEAPDLIGMVNSVEFWRERKRQSLESDKNTEKKNDWD
ncbi:glycosyltransferase family 2 protein [Butyrivibrio sp. YAB3001]|uniref:glycosyltransferase family 2 protein n=1 Tax=Butyrivibrio sp. YAB3001 TaxID=1520812 RepID=UPI0008F66720|nr:glycosyltransferase family 2 protein [Butyrivibrio sp. YAB3001]SFC86781.1 Glycosyltransferase involved in cell wall bisynthesis [Butyrivibrio sp. YAB3001]